MTWPVNGGPQAHGPHASGGSRAVFGSDEIRLLTEIGFLAAAKGDLPRAEAIFGALRQVRPGRLFPVLGIAVAWMNAGRAADAAGLLEKAACADADEQAIRDTWRGLALQLAGQAAQSRHVLQQAVSEHGANATFAHGLLGLERDMS